jgi:ribonuclease HII
MILGIDEVGRGPYAGPLVIGACILPSAEIAEREPEKYAWFFQLTDSKKLTAAKRESLYDKIKQGALASATGWVTSTEIDEIGISESLRLACRRAVKQIQEAKVPFSEIIIDGTMNFLVGTPLEKYVSTLKKGDLLVKEISAASIIAKVERDHYMIELSKKYPGYGFEKHVGYGTGLHQRMMEELGLTPEHRKSFRPVQEIWLRTGAWAENPKITGDRKINHPDSGPKPDSGPEPDSDSGPNSVLESGDNLTTSEIGNHGEEVVTKYLEAEGHEILFRNFKTKQYEIDIISRKADGIYFTEVKYRKNARYGEPLDFIDKKKRKQMEFAAKSFLRTHAESSSLVPYLAAASVSGDFILDEWFLLTE